MEYKTETISWGDNCEITLQREVLDGMALPDTKVLVNGRVLCYISYDDKNDFLEKLKSTVENFRI